MTTFRPLDFSFQRIQRTLIATSSGYAVMIQRRTVRNNSQNADSIHLLCDNFLELYSQELV
jgi:hypothetical protein